METLLLTLLVAQGIGWIFTVLRVERLRDEASTVHMTIIGTIESFLERQLEIQERRGGTSNNQTGSKSSLSTGTNDAGGAAGS